MLPHCEQGLGAPISTPKLYSLPHREHFQSFDFIGPSIILSGNLPINLIRSCSFLITDGFFSKKVPPLVHPLYIRSLVYKNSSSMVSARTMGTRSKCVASNLCLVPIIGIMVYFAFAAFSINNNFSYIIFRFRWFLLNLL